MAFDCINVYYAYAPCLFVDSDTASGCDAKISKVIRNQPRYVIAFRGATNQYPCVPIFTHRNRDIAPPIPIYRHVITLAVSKGPIKIKC